MRIRHRQGSVPLLAVAWALLLVGCEQPDLTKPTEEAASRQAQAAQPSEGGADATKQAGTPISGVVKAPPGVFDQQTARRPRGLLDDLLISPAYALGGLVSIGNVTVALWDSNARAEPIGAPIVVTNTDPYGHYVLVAPPTYVVGPGLILVVGDPVFMMRRLVTGVVYQDVTFYTEASVRLLVRQTVYYPVDVRVIEPARLDTVYVTVGRSYADFDFAPLLKVKGPKKIVLNRAVDEIVLRSTPRTEPVRIAHLALQNAEVRQSKLKTERGHSRSIGDGQEQGSGKDGKDHGKRDAGPGQKAPGGEAKKSPQRSGEAKKPHRRESAAKQGQRRSGEAKKSQQRSGQAKKSQRRGGEAKQSQRGATRDKQRSGQAHKGGSAAGDRGGSDQARKGGGSSAGDRGGSSQAGKGGGSSGGGGHGGGKKGR